ncbi:MAG: LysM peptidoglycan-binding domain-containing protein [Verrucomicrobia bacterium]|jgi:LysM repeat protein|nr:LysM peptidoglycan-binding domain-containing protein [Verrucomicrobiota bacterium]MBT7065543.1 LysM peptidoglycan-binding domain-containing protein [Verrucomicrobiota bacterium]MBT7700739.1 LysM peptidoglycan-binding domain-containing protein [Verrucomicrobiota bacterium]
MKTPWVIGIVAGAHVLAVAGIMLIQGCGTTQQGTLPETVETVMPPSAATPAPVQEAPVAPPTVTEWPPSTTTEYKVKPGESLSKIAARYGLSTRELAALNGIDDPNKIRVGQKLTLPGKKDVAAPAPAAPVKEAATPAVKKPNPVKVSAAGTYEVTSGDCLSKIAVAHGCTTKALMAANDLTAEKIFVGQKLTIPTGAAKKPVPTQKPVVTKKPVTAKKPVVANPLSLDSPPVELPDPDLDMGVSGGVREIVVADGEDLPRIAMRYGVTVTQLKELNTLVDGTVRPGQKIKIPIGE